MNRSTARSFGVIVASAVVSMWPAASGAQPAPAGPFTADQVREEFVRQGYQVDTPITWWTNGHVTTFTVSDPAGQEGQAGRILMVLVYPDTATANAELGRALAREVENDDDQHTSVPAPHLVPGYGPSVLRENVALVESTQQELSRRYAAQLDRDNLSPIGTDEPIARGTATYAVDVDFLGVLDNGLVNL